MKPVVLHRLSPFLKSPNELAVFCAASLLSVLIGYTLIQPLFVLFNRQTVDDDVVGITRSINRGQTPEEFLMIKEWNLFGVSGAVTAQREVVQKTELLLKLEGIYAPVEGNDGWVIIATEQDQGHRYEVGDKVNQEAVVSEIQVDKVLLERNGRLEALSLEKETLSFE